MNNFAGGRIRRTAYRSCILALYEVVALGPAAIRGNEWVARIPQGLNVVKLSVADVRVEHEVKLMDFTKRLDKTGGWPREVSDRHKIRSILGMPVAR